MTQNRDVMDLAVKDGTVSTIDDISLWEEIVGLPIDYHPSFGWNVSDYSRGDSFGMALAMQCASVKARDIAKAGMALWRRQGKAWEGVGPKEHWFARMLSRTPNQFMSWGDFWRLIVLQLEIAQDAYILPRINRAGEVLELLPIPPARIRPRVSDSGRLFYEIAASTEIERAMVGNEFIVLPAYRVIHIMGRSLNGITGLSNALLGNATFDLIGAINRYQTALFANNGKIPVAFETEKEFTGDMANAAFTRLRDQLAAAWRENQLNGKPLLLEAGLKAKTLANSAKDNVTTEALNQQIIRICSLMMVPPHKIFAYESVKYDNQAAADNQYASDCLIPIADNIEEKLRNGLLTEEELDEYWPEFDRERMTAGDTKAINERVKIAMMLGVMTVNEARERFGLNPVEGGDVRLTPVNMAMVDEDGEIVAQPAAGQPNNDGTGQGAGTEPQKGGHRLMLVK